MDTEKDQSRSAEAERQSAVKYTAASMDRHRERFLARRTHPISLEGYEKLLASDTKS